MSRQASVPSWEVLTYCALDDINVKFPLMLHWLMTYEIGFGRTNRAGHR